jgi:predicted dehydrogenase
MRKINVQSGRRSFLQSILLTGAAPFFVPARLLRAETAPSNKITLGVIGAGSQGRVDMKAFLNHDDVRVVALCDANKHNVDLARAAIRERYGSDDAKVHPDFRDLNRDSSIDAVLMALPVHWHSIPSTDAILQGKHIYHEKPMGMSIEESKHVRAAVQKKGVVFQFGTQQRSDLKFRWASELALNGRLGPLQEIQVGVEGGIQTEVFPEQPLPANVDWDRWVGPAVMTPFHENKLKRKYHENISLFSLGMVSCWGIHHLDIANWGNGTGLTGPTSIEGTGVFPQSGTCDAVLSWNLRYEFAQGAPITFVNQNDQIGHGLRFIGKDAWVHVVRGNITASNETLLRDPENKYGTMSVKLPESKEHTRNFVDAIRNGTRALCDIESSVRSDTLCQLAAIAVKLNRKLNWDAQAESFINDETANAMLKHREFRGEWKLPEIG